MLEENLCTYLRYLSTPHALNKQGLKKKVNYREKQPSFFFKRIYEEVFFVRISRPMERLMMMLMDIPTGLEIYQFHTPDVQFSAQL